MNKCDVCGNEYDKSFKIIVDNKEYIFDSFECAVHKLAPNCVYCACKIIGHGVEQDGQYFCCAHCAKQMGTTDLKDRE